ncbi:MAG: putative esterase of the alpha/beta hydrolase fold protein [Candidatus Accumulibacter regalis]|jgi:alpha/beta superfamily hydrolase|uniref:Esterase of the alpha/beta hydrolase fold protein n=3 Tax=Candidatus Accumulibacter TaxID=327159 RepID=A0A011RBF7_ACCRE|nr:MULTISPECIES: alpha/beta hydrolase [unclassified Candidatus Accumulibacter]EXI88519.1 MAG: putative esterase of the alpha/beta hydrolase fold protein [Candidatus Accumulibacter regalis]MBN8514943.1 alpha/beta hydrolase [Accumulibacter sp.]MBO3702019.1 alpha/beta hydrolase [Accumulibacter sp.]HRE71909.1 alpha/beta hydrolase [Accumulibacter sp.]HRE86374.1 alpha/beta hydrolase [Accumulibacter sp.]
MKVQPEHLLFDGPVGKIEVIVENPGAPRGIAMIGHPHPLFGGGNTNKVVQTLARTFNHLDYVALRPNFRGIGQTEGTHDDGRGETEDLLAVLAEAKCRYGNLPVALAGFSFGAYVQTRVADALREAGHPAQRLVLVGTASGFVEGLRQYRTKAVPGDTIVIHGSEDTTVPLANVIEWAKPLELPVIVVPGADHFFHRRLHVIREIVTRAWRH